MSLIITPGGMINPMTTGGDLIYGGTSGAPTRLANGSSGQALTSGGGTSAPTWVTPPLQAYTAQTTNYNILFTDSTIVFSAGSFTATLPDATTSGQAGKVFTIINNGVSLSQTVTINTTSAQTIITPNGTLSSGTFVMTTKGESLTLVNSGTNWFQADHVTATPWNNAGALTISSTAAYVFTVTSASATLGAIYSNNGQTFQVMATIASQLSLTCSGTGTPAASGTLTKVSGTGDSTITFSSKTITGQPVKGTVPTDNFWWERVGSKINYRYEYVQTAGGSTGGTGNYLIYMPTGLAIDTTVLLTGSRSITSLVGSHIGTGAISNTSTMATGSNTVEVVPYDAGLFYLRVFTTTPGMVWNGPANGSQTLNNTNYIVLVGGTVSISGWQP